MTAFSSSAILEGSKIKSFLQVKEIRHRGVIVELEIFPEHPFHFVEFAIMADAVVAGSRRDSWLLGIKLPNVYIEHKRFFISTGPVTNSVAHDRIRNLSKIIPA